MLEFGLLEKRAITSTMLGKVSSEELAGECDPTGDRHQVSYSASYCTSWKVTDLISIVEHLPAEPLKNKTSPLEFGRRNQFVNLNRPDQENLDLPFSDPLARNTYTALHAFESNLVIIESTEGVVANT